MRKVEVRTSIWVWLISPCSSETALDDSSPGSDAIEVVQPELDRRQVLLDGIVQLARHPAPLVLPRQQQPSGSPALPAESGRRLAQPPAEDDAETRIFETGHADVGVAAVRRPGRPG